MYETHTSARTFPCKVGASAIEALDASLVIASTHTFSCKVAAPAIETLYVCFCSLSTTLTLQIFADVSAFAYVVIATTPETSNHCYSKCGQEEDLQLSAMEPQNRCI